MVPLKNSRDVNNLLVDELEISVETTGDDVSWLNGMNEIHIRSIHIIVRAVLLKSNQYANKWFCAEDTSSEVHRCKLHSTLDNN